MGHNRIDSICQPTQAARFARLVLAAMLVLLLLAGLANQASAYVFNESFEGYSIGVLDKNYSTGPNASANGVGNPWFGPGPPNDCVDTNCAHSGKGIRANSLVYMLDYINIAYRYNGGVAYTGNIYVDWWFYNPASSNRQNYRDHLELGYYSTFPTNTDYPTTVPITPSTSGIWVGAADGANQNGYTTSNWQVRIPNATGGYNTSGCFNVGTRATGWHKGRIKVGPRDGSKHCSVSVYIDDMNTALKTATTTVDTSFNSIRVNNYDCGSSASPAYQAYYDDIVFGMMPTTPGPAVGISGPDTGQITWNVTENCANEDGYKVYDALSGGNLKATSTGTAANAVESGLQGNTQYTRWISAYDGPFESGRVALSSVYSAPDPPEFLTSVMPYGSYGTFYTADDWPGIENPQGFGTDGRVSYFKFKWAPDGATLAHGEGTDWSGGMLMTIPDAPGTYYAYFRSYNAVDVSNPHVLKVGPFNFGTGRHLIWPDTCDADAGSVTPQVSAVDGESVTVTATPNAGYSFKSWSRDSCDSADEASASASYTFIMGDNDVYLFAHFTKDPIVTVATCQTLGGSVTGSGSAKPGAPTTVTATAKPGYTFVNWTSDGCGGTNVASTNASYTFDMGNADITLSANFTADPHSFAVTTCGNGTVSGTDGTYNTDDSVTVGATPNAAYKFKNWTRDGCGGTSVASTSANYTFKMPPNDLTLSANFQKLPFLTTAASPIAGGSVVGGGFYDTGAAAPVSVTTNANFFFVGWSTKADGTAMVSRKQSFNYAMPAADTTLYAIFAKAKFFEGFEGLNAGCIDMNYATGNPATNGDLNSGNPWMGYMPDDSYAVTTGVGTSNLSGLKMLGVPGTGWSNCLNVANIAYRCNGGTPLSGNFQLDWQFFDPRGAGAGNVYQDYIGLALYPGNVLGATTDYSGTDMKMPLLLSDESQKTHNEIQRIQVGGAGEPGYDATKYQYRAVGVTGTYGSGGWVDSTVTRSVGWHRGRILVSPAKESGTNDVSIFIDDMSNPIASFDSTTTGGYNAIQVMNSAKASPGTAWAQGYFDNIEILTPGTQSIDKWAYIGHYAHATQSTRISTDFFAGSGKTEATMWASNGKTYNGKSWATCDGGVVNFNKLYGATTTNGVSYLFTYVMNNNAEPITDAELTVGSDDGIAAFLNGTEVITSAPDRSFLLDQDRTGPLTLTAGVNRLMLKVTQGTADYKGQARLTHVDGSPLAGVTYFTSEDTVPSGTITINDGAAQTTDRNVSLTFTTRYEISGIASMSFSDDGVTYSAPEPFVPSRTYLLPEGLGTKNVYVKFADGANNISAPAIATIELIEHAIPAHTEVAKISDLWPLANNSTVYGLDNKTVTAVWSDGFWIEEADRTAGIKVAWTGSPSVSAGDSVDVFGTLSASAERILTASFVTNHGAAAEAIKPLGVIGRSSGGKGVNADTPGATDATGLYNVGLLVRIAGKAANAGSNFFYLDDGSGLTTGGISGIKVLCGSLSPASSGTQVVTGVVGIEAGKPVIYATSIRTP